MSAAATSIVANLLLVPRFGGDRRGVGQRHRLRRAWRRPPSCCRSGSTRSRSSTGRLARVVAAGLRALAAALALPAMPPLAAGLARGVTVVVVWPLLLAILGFFDARELRTLGRVVERVRAGRPMPVAVAATADATVPDVTLTDEPPLTDEVTLPEPRPLSDAPLADRGRS